MQGIRDRKGQYQFMSAATAATLCNRLAMAMRLYGWNPRVEFAMHGEPSVHPDFVGMVRRFGELRPRELIVVSNGTGFVKDPVRLVRELVAAGVTSICLDEYEGCDYVPRMLARYVGDVPVPVYQFDGEAPTKFRGAARGEPYIVVKRDVSHLTTPFDKANTHCGAGGPPAARNPALHKRCAKPFREMSIRWDGNVSHCCNDFRGVYKVGNIADYPTLDELWQHERFEAARRMLYHGNRDFVPCNWCDALSPRVGLLPDKYGKETMPEPDADTYQVLAEAIDGDPYTTPVLRGWEVGEGAEPCLPPALIELGTDLLRRQPIDGDRG